MVLLLKPFFSLAKTIHYSFCTEKRANYTFRTSNFGSAGGVLGVLGKGFASMELA